ncbi:unnamed protein product [Acanthoscelides obtectus]|uniref:Uncharacterized protein n=1 Tax=Acanthoscelides obtectus TaxID=200917 RepID=A0A9P0PBG1_ACAOB|nr:unnamed protein product [Acanthoscelides obtectus]CAK1655783.1 hypothetical protein AOBTE_LOCUS19332 [Acanthoscelides obtectus]
MYTFTLSGRESVLPAKIYPPIVLDNSKTYPLGLIDFLTFSTIPNIDITNNKFHIDDEVVTVPEGSYEIKDIIEFIKERIKPRVGEQNKKRRMSPPQQQQQQPQQKRSLSSNAIVKDDKQPDIQLHMRNNLNTLRESVAKHAMGQTLSDQQQQQQQQQQYEKVELYCDEELPKS